MPSFANPWALLLLLALPAIVWRWRKRNEAALAFPAIKSMIDAPMGRATVARRGSLVLKTAGLSLLVVALAGPPWPHEGSRLPPRRPALARRRQPYSH